MIRTNWTLVALTMLIGSLIQGCGGGGRRTPAVPTPAVGWSFAGLEALAPGFEYEGWIIVGGAPVSTGRFTVDMAGIPSSTSAPISDAEAAGATAFVLTIEPMPDPDTGPSATKILAGDFNAGQANLTVDHPAALADDFTAATGEFILATPSSAVMTDESQGIWWFDPTTGGPTLQLPALPLGWTYEGWVVGGSGPVSTGRFRIPDDVDSDLAGPSGGPDSSGPPFPGQDFVIPALDLVGLTAVISVEPEPDDSPAPFTLKPLVVAPIGPDLAPTLQTMVNNAAVTNPTGIATISVP